MSWHEPTLRLEIAVEFQRLAPVHWDSMEEALWQRRHRELAAWAEHGQWWRKTTAGRARMKVGQQRRTAAAKKRTVGVRVCTGCHKTFAVSAYRVGRGHDRVCSTACRGASRSNIERYTIGTETMTLTEWADRHGVKMSTIWKRIKKMGWTVERAVTMRGTRMAREGRAK